MKCQIICTTHSFEILSSLPPEGRVYLDSVAGTTQVLKGVSAEYACGKMGRSGASELDIFVEDQVAQTIVEASLDQNLRTRCNVLEIGSHSSLKRLMAGRYMENRKNCLCLLDGDQKSTFEDTQKEIANSCDGKFSAQSEIIQEWVKTNLDYMPGEDWPEKWIFTKGIECFESWQEMALQFWAIESAAKLKELLEDAMAAGKHEEFRTLAAALALQEENVRSQLITWLRTSIPESFSPISDKVSSLLS